MALGDKVSKPYVAGGSPTDSLSAVDFVRPAIGGLTPMVQEVTQGRAVITGTIVANGGSVSGQIMGAPSCMVQVTGTWQLDLVVQTSMDGTNWSNPQILWEVDRFPAFVGHMQLGMNALVGAQSRNGQFRVVTEGAQYVRVFAQAAGGTPGTATVTVTSSPIAMAFPTLQGYNICVFDNVDLTATRLSPVFVHPGPGWRYDLSMTTPVNVTGQVNARLQVELSDTFSFANFSVGITGVGFWNSNVAGYSPGEDIANANQLFISNFLRFRLQAGTFGSVGTQTIYANFMPPLSGPKTFNPGVADQSTNARDNLGLLTLGPVDWHGALMLATDSAANTNTGGMRRLRVDASQQLLVTPGVSNVNTGTMIRRNQRNLGAKVAVAGFSITVYGFQIVNNQAAAAYVQIFDLALAGVTLGTTVPDHEYLVAANSTLPVQLPSLGVNFNTACTAASTTTEAGAVASAAGVHLFVQSNN